MIDTKTEPRTAVEAAHELTVLLGHIEALVRECPTPLSMVNRMVEDGAELVKLTTRLESEDFTWSWIKAKMPHFAESVVVESPRIIRIYVGNKALGDWQIADMFAYLHQGIR